MANKFDFPVIRVRENGVYFNAKCDDFENARSIIVSKSGDCLIFRPSDNLDGFRIRRRKDTKAFSIPSAAIRHVSQIEKNRSYQLQHMKCGAWYVTINEPLEV